MIAWRHVASEHLNKTSEAQVLHQVAWQLLGELLPIYIRKQSINLSYKDKKKGVDWVKIARDAFNKPYLPEYPMVQFNLSHCKGMVACIISSKAVGIDVEPIRPFHPAVMRKVCSHEEQKLIEEASCQEESFFRLWTLKESYIKAVGKGLRLSMKQVCFQWTPDGQIISNQPEYQFRQVILENQFILSICEKN